MLSHLLNKEKGQAPWEWGGTEGSLQPASPGDSKVPVPCLDRLPHPPVPLGLVPQLGSKLQLTFLHGPFRGSGHPHPDTALPHRTGFPELVREPLASLQRPDSP